MFKRVEKFFSGVVSGTSAESSSAPASDSAFGAGVPSEPAKQVRSYLFDQAEGLAGGAASMRLVGFCESPVAGKYFVADGRSMSGSSCFSEESGSGTVFSFNARRLTTRPVFHAPEHHTLLWFGAVSSTTTTRYTAYLQYEDGSGVVFVLKPCTQNVYYEVRGFLHPITRGFIQCKS